MELFVIRHGVAENKQAYADIGKDDSLRPLTKEGRWKMEHGTKGLRRTLPSLDLIGTNPFQRAEQSAMIVARAHGRVGFDCVDALSPDGQAMPS